MRIRLGVALGALVALALVLVAVSACSSDSNDEDIEAINARLDEMDARITRAQILATETVFWDEGMHELAEHISEADEIDANWLGSVARMRRAVAGTVWPDELKEKSDELLTHLQELESALEDEDLSEVKTHAPEAHDAWHELDFDAYRYVAGEEPSADESPTPTGGHGHGGGTTTSSPSATPGM